MISAAAPTTSRFSALFFPAFRGFLFLFHAPTGSKLHSETEIWTPFLQFSVSSEAGLKASTTPNPPSHAAKTENAADYSRVA